MDIDHPPRATVASKSDSTINTPKHPNLSHENAAHPYRFMLLVVEDETVRCYRSFCLLVVIPNKQKHADVDELSGIR